MDLGVLLDPIENSLNFGQELLAQTWPLVLISVKRFVDLVPDARLEDERQAHRGRLTEALISSQVKTFPGSASRAARR